MYIICVVAGIVFAIVAGVFTYIAAVQIPTPITFPGADKLRKETIAEGHNAMSRGWENFPPDDVEKALKIADQKTKKRYEELDHEILIAWWSDRNLMVKRSGFGVLALILSGICQVGAVIFAP